MAGSPSYDTGEDAIVRVTASDVRKRLHQFYADLSPASEVRIDLPTGSYIPDFRIAAPPTVLPVPVTVVEQVRVPAKAAPSARRTRLLSRRPALYAVAAIVIAGASIWIWYQHSLATRLSPKSVLPWSAIIERDRQIHMVLSDPDLSTLQELFGVRPSLSDYANRRYVPDSLVLDAGMRRVVRSLRGVNVALVDSGIALQVSELAQASSAHIKTHNARSLQLADFKTEDSFVVLGSPRSNPWSTLFEEQLDFAFAYDETLKQEIIRNKRPRQGELDLYVPTARGFDTGHAFAILAFVANPGQKGHVLLLAGTNAEATEAAGSLAANLDLLSRTLERFGIDPRGPVCHFELLLQVRTMAGSPSTLEVIACRRQPKGAGGA